MDSIPRSVTVENPFDEGYLYDDYNDYNFEPPEAFEKLVINYVSALSYSGKVEFLTDLDNELSVSSYSTFSGLHQLSEKVFVEDDLPHLKTMLVSDYPDLSLDLVENYYRQVTTLLSPEERKGILSVLKDKDSSWLLELAKLFQTEGRTKESIATLKKWLSGNSTDFINEEVYFLYLDLLKEENLDLLDTAKGAISRCSTSTMLQKIATLLPEDIAIYEKILEQKNADDFLDYLEISGRLSEITSGGVN